MKAEVTVGFSPTSKHTYLEYGHDLEAIRLNAQRKHRHIISIEVIPK